MKQPPKWSAEEIECLLDLSTRYPTYRLRGVYRSWAGRNGFPMRTDNAITRKLYTLGHRARPVYDNWNCKTLSELLGFKSSRVWYWFRYHPDWTTRQKGHGVETVTITQKDLCRFAADHPHLFRGADEYGLQIALGEQLATQVQQQNANYSVTRPVYCVELWKVFPSAKAAVEALFPWHPRKKSLSRNIRLCCEGRYRSSYGYHWRFADEQQEAA